MFKLAEYLVQLLFPLSKNEERVLSQNPHEFKRTSETPDSFIYSVLDYKNEDVRTLIWLVKYHGNRRAAMKCGQILSEELVAVLADKHAFEEIKTPIVVPIPLSKERRTERGFNQSHLLAKALVKKSSSPLTLMRVIERTKDTKSQTDMPSKTARIQNVADCFAVTDPESVSDRDIIIIDDVTTTGATLSEARKVLKEAEARNIIALTVAH